MMKKRQSGAAMVELAFILPLLVILLMGTVHFGLVMYRYIQVDKAIHDGARYAGMRTLSLQPGDEGAFELAVKRKVVYGSPTATSGANVPGLTNVSQVEFDYEVDATTGIPRLVRVWVNGWTVNGVLGNVNFAGKPAASFPFLGRFVPATPLP